MALTKLSTSMDNVQGLADLVQDQATAVKQTFDKAGNDIKTYVNDTLTAEQDAINTDLDGRLETAEGEIDALQTADGQNVKLTGNQTVAGTKTFSSSPIVPAPTTDTQASTKKYVDDENAKDVHLTGNQTVAGVKTFSSSPIVPTPTVSGQASTKGYVDTAIAGVIMGQVPDNSLTTAKYQDGSVTAAKLDFDPATQAELDELSTELDGLAGVGRTTETVKENADNLTTHLADNTHHVPHLGTTTNVSNTYSITSTKVILDGSKFSVKFNAAATGTATLNISSDGTGRTLKKPDGTDFKPKAGIYSFIRDGANFQLLGEGGGGNATASDLLSGKTATTDAGDITGTMPNKVGSATTINPSTSVQAIPQGYYGGAVGDGKVAAVTGTAGAGDVGVGKTFSSASGVNQTGTGANVKKIYSTDTASSSSGTTTFTKQNGTTVGLPSVTVNGLDFQPDVIEMWKNGTYSCVLFPANIGSNNARIILTAPNDASSINTFRLDGTAAYVNGTGFRLPWIDASATGISIRAYQV